MRPEGQDPLYATLLAATLGQLMLAVTRDLYPHRTYFDLTSTEKQTVAEQVRNLLHEVQTTFAELHIRSHSGRGEIDFPPQREEEYL
ncbi:MAG: hypothetical protein ACE5K9_08590 [Candidatus Methylomirabilales bacterium]